MLVTNTLMEGRGERRKPETTRERRTGGRKRQRGQRRGRKERGRIFQINNGVANLLHILEFPSEDHQPDNATMM